MVTRFTGLYCIRQVKFPFEICEINVKADILNYPNFRLSLFHSSYFAT
jgi:hypothetical protein